MIPRFLTRSAVALVFLVHMAASEGWGQQVVRLTEGLSLNISTHYGRDAVVTDPLAARLYAGTLSLPTDGQLFSIVGGTETRWKAVKADTSGQFRVRNSQGYLYLRYKSAKPQTALLNINGNNAVFVNGKLHTGDPYAAGWLSIPVQLNKGLNEFYVRGASVKAELRLSPLPLSLATDDATLPTVVLSTSRQDLMAALVITNASASEQRGLQLSSTIGNNTVVTEVPVLLPMSSRKIIFHLNASAIVRKGKAECRVALLQKGRTLDQKILPLEVADGSDKYKVTFVSGIDGSLQYYAVTPKSGSDTTSSSLFLSVHGAGVEAISQARAYHSKDWGNLVAATNRRPRGFNWEDWGRLDALEVLALAKKQFQPDPQRIYLTGHSMGGHGTWFLGATYPGLWAGIAPSAGYPSLKTYGSADGQIPDSSLSPIGKLLLRSGNQSDVLKLITNYKPLGIYILHGDADENVSVNYARQMRSLLGTFHADFSYYEYPGGQHWFGDQCVDWPAMFTFLKDHRRATDSTVLNIDFTTANPGISASMRWATIRQQAHPLAYSRIQLSRNLKKATLTGKTDNVKTLTLRLNDFPANATLAISLDQTPPITYRKQRPDDSVTLGFSNGTWSLVTTPTAREKGPLRYGTFKEAFSKNMVFVYGTTGTASENDWSRRKALFDAETWYYRGNGAVDIVRDTEYRPSAYTGRNVILFGNATTNAAWKLLLGDCPIVVERDRVTAGSASFTGSDLGAYFVWPIAGTASNSVAVITGSGLPGMNSAMANQYFAGGSGFPDFMIFRAAILEKGESEVEIAGFFDNNWALSGDDFTRKQHE